MTEHRDLKLLPRDHPARNTPLGDIGAEYLSFLTNEWTKPNRLSRFTFNELDASRLEWRVPPLDTAEESGNHSRAGECAG